MSLKVRKNQSPPTPVACPLLDCMSIIGGAWKPNIIWYLRGGPRRFSELRMDIPQISAKILTTRLREMEEAGVVTRTILNTSPPSVEYRLSPLGEELVPAIEGIAKVGEKLQAHAALKQGSAKPVRHFSSS